MDTHFHDDVGNPAGGTSSGIGYLIAWQNGPCPLDDDGNPTGRNGAFLTEVLEACERRLEHYQTGGWSCVENESALLRLRLAIEDLDARRDRRRAAGSLGTHKPD